MRGVGVWLALLVLAAGLSYIVVVGHADAIYVNITNETVYVKFGNMTVLEFNTTLVNFGWFNSTHLACVYSCLYAHNADLECHDIRVRVFEGTVQRYEVVYDASSNNTLLCGDMPGMCYGAVLFPVGNFTEPARIIIDDLTTNETYGPYVFEFPYTGPSLTGYARFIPLLTILGLVFGLAGRHSLKNVGIGLFVFGILAPSLIVLGVDPKDIILTSTISILLGVILIWFSNQ